MTNSMHVTTEEELDEARARVQEIAKRLFGAYTPGDFLDLRMAALATGLIAMQLLRLANADDKEREEYLNALKSEGSHLRDWLSGETLELLGLAARDGSSTTIH